MREIKFRVWYANQEMHYGIAPIDNKYYIFFETQKRNAHDLQINRAISIMQYTGLNDKNGKEIYEGDIVKLVSTEWADDDPIIDVVEWGLGDRSYPAFDLKKFSYETEMNSFSYIFNSGYYEIEVIGNIYENPELLKGESK